MIDRPASALPFQSSERKSWVEGDAHGLAVAAVLETRREMEESSLGLDRMVEERAFKPYVYHSISGAGTALESALRHADSRVLVGRPRSSGALSDSCLSRFDGFGAGAGDATGGGRGFPNAPGGYGLASSSLGGAGLSRFDAPGACGTEGTTSDRPPVGSSPGVPVATSSGLFDVSTRTLMSGASSLVRKL
jgi:hypothetical protein